MKLDAEIIEAARELVATFPPLTPKQIDLVVNALRAAAEVGESCDG